MNHSQYIHLPQALSFYEAASEAYRTVKPWNCFITLHLETAGIKPKEASKHVRESLQRLGKYHRRNGMAFSYGWVLENALVKGVHVHILVHRPKELPMHPMSYYWAILKIFRIKRSKGILKTEKFYAYQSYHINIASVLRYTLKGLRLGAEGQFADITGFKLGRPVNEGLIYGKRIGWSR
jgi:hypothetical protein